MKAADHAAVKRHRQNIMNAENLVATRHTARRFAWRWQGRYPKAAARLRDELEELLACFRFRDPQERKAVLTASAIKRREPKKVRRRTRPMRMFAERTSMEHIPFAVYTYENRNQGIAAPFLLRQDF